MNKNKKIIVLVISVFLVVSSSLAKNIDFYIGTKMVPDKSIETNKSNEIKSEPLQDLGASYIGGYDNFLGSFIDVDVKGNLTYVITTSGELLIFNISGYQFKLLSVYPVDFFDPEEVKINGGGLISVADEFAYMVLKNLGIVVINVTDPYLPTYATYYEGLEAVDLYVENNILYLVTPIITQTSHFDIYDVTIITNPQFISRYSVPTNYIYQMEIKDNYAYFGCRDGIIILNLNDLNNPVEAYNFDFQTLSNAVVREDILIVNKHSYYGSQLLFYNISDIENPVFCNYYNLTEDTSSDIYLANNIVYLRKSSGFLAIDVSNITTPTVIATYAVSFNQYTPIVLYPLAFNESIKSHIMLCLVTFSSLNMYLFTPPNLVSISTYNQTQNPNKIYVTDNELYYSTYSILYILSIENKNDIYLQGEYACPSEIKDFVIWNDLAFIATKSNGLEIINLTDFSNPTKIGIYIFASSSLGVVLDEEEEVLYVNIGSAIVSLDISSPETPNFIDYFGPADRTIKYLQLYKDYLFVYGWYGLDFIYGYIYIYDISNPEEVSLITTKGNFGVVTSFHIENDYLYILYDTNYLHTTAKYYAIYNIETIETFQQVYITNQYPLAEKIYVKNNIAYLFFGNSYLEIQNVSDKTLPIHIQTYYGKTASSLLKDIYEYDCYLYINEFCSGIQIYKFDVCPPPTTPPTSTPKTAINYLSIILIVSSVLIIIYTFKVQRKKSDKK
ncbi:MAG: hypothetical protein JXA54_04415 [Candidatus Heimdallarchaeota archaeon]|nr:hypothetical protein [Candidatus Heimdallarchaeota archaeon]